MKHQNSRIGKGKSLILFPNDFVTIDIETTGLSFSCSIMEIAALKISNGEIVDSFSSLVRPVPFYFFSEGLAVPHYIDSVISELTGITDAMLENAPKLKNVLPLFKSFIGNNIVVGHNVASFDSNFIYDAYQHYFDQPFSNDCVDTMRLSRWLLPDLKRHRLIDICQHFKLSSENTHRALDDCETALKCFKVYKNIKVHFP